MALERRILKIAYWDEAQEKIAREVSYPITPKVDIEFERRFGKSLNATTESATAMYQLAWLLQSKHLEGYPGSFPADVEAWVEGVAALDFKTEAIAPFEQEAGAAGSPSSASPRGSLRAIS